MDFFEEEEFARVNVTPLTDVAFTLLITLMIVTSYLAIKTSPFRVILPAVETVEPRGAEVVTIDIDERGESLAINGILTSWNDYLKEISSEAEKDPFRLLLIRADKNTPHGIVMRVLSDIKKLKSDFEKEDKYFFERIAFGTRKKK